MNLLSAKVYTREIFKNLSSAKVYAHKKNLKYSSAKVNVREKKKFRGQLQPRNFLPAKVCTLKVLSIIAKMGLLAPCNSTIIECNASISGYTSQSGNIVVLWTVQGCVVMYIAFDIYSSVVTVMHEIVLSFSKVLLKI